jgi:hypothetical protein
MRSAMRSADQHPQTRSSRKTPSLAADLAELGAALRSLFDPYRPELFYMRGPGPKWHAKHDRRRPFWMPLRLPLRAGFFSG